MKRDLHFSTRYLVMVTSRRLRFFPRFWGLPQSAVVLLYKPLIEVAIYDVLGDVGYVSECGK